MPYLLTLLCVITCTVQNPLNKSFQEKHRGGIYLYPSMVSLFAVLFFTITSLLTGGLRYEWGVLPYSVLFGASAALCNVSLIVALRSGSLALTALITSYSLMIPTVYGMIFLHETPGVLAYIGIVLLVISLYLTNAKGDQSEQKTRVSGKWLLFVTLSAIGNGACSIIQREEQIAFDGGYKNEFMIVALLVSVLFTLPFILVKERREAPTSLKAGWGYALLSGTANGTTNLLVMTVTATIATSVFFPIISAGGMVLSYILSVTLYKERFTKWQTVGIALGVLSLVFLNI